MSIYGKMDISGIHADDPEPCPNVYNEAKGYWTHEWKNRLIPEEVEYLKLKYDTETNWVGRAVPDPKKMIEIVDAGINDHYIAISCLAEILHQMYNTDQYQTLITID